MPRRTKKRMKYTLKSLRESRGLTQAELARRAGVDIRRVQRLEKGEIRAKNLSLETAIAICKALNITPEKLIALQPGFRLDLDQLVDS